MNINLTLIVQAINFGIAYTIISRYFLKPALELVFKEEKERADIRNQLMQEQKIVEQKKENKKNLWIKFQDFFNLHKPSKFYVLPKQSAESIKVKEQYKEDKLTQVASNIVNGLKEKILND